MTPYHEAIAIIVNRYLQMKVADEKLESFMIDLYDGCWSNMPICKANRWLGYIQGVLIERGHLTVEGERDATRPLFRPLDFPEESGPK